MRILSLSTLILVLISCQSNQPQETTLTDIKIDTSVKFDPAAVKGANTNNSVNQASFQQPTTAALPVSNPVAPAALTAQNPVSNSGGLKYNPEHGKPGHRCDLEVGAPLPGTSAATTQQATITPTPTGTSVNISKEQLEALAAKAQPAQPLENAQPAPAKNSSVKLNPEHGKPGHRCDLEVGAPLNSAPKTATSKTTVTPVAAPSPAVPATNAAGQKLNPAHGQPGHDCTIEVGQPLKK